MMRILLLLYGRYTYICMSVYLCVITYLMYLCVSTSSVYVSWEGNGGVS